MATRSTIYRRDGRRPAAALTTMLAATALAACALTACAGASTGTDIGGSGGRDSGPITVAAVIKGLDNPFFQTMEAGIQEGADDTDVQVTVQAATSITDTDGQAAKLSALAGQEFSCYIVNPITGTNLVQGLAQLAAQGKTVVNIDSPLDAGAARGAGATPVTYIGTDNVAAGQLAADEMTERVGSGDVAVIGGPRTDVTSGNRISGFTGALGPSVAVVTRAAADWSRDKARARAATALREHPQLKGFYVANDDMALGVVEAVKKAGRSGQVTVIGTDGVEEALNSIRRGGLTATVAQYPYVIGRMGIEACAVAAEGLELPTTVQAPVQLVTTDVVDQALAALPQPFDAYQDPLATLLP